MPTSHTPNMAHHSEPMVEVHFGPTTSPPTGSKNIKHLKGALASQPLRNIIGSNRKGTGSNGNLSTKVSNRRDNKSTNSGGSPTAKAHADSNFHGELHLGDNHKTDIDAATKACYYAGTESNDAQGGTEAGGMEMDDNQERIHSGM